jgi:hypothetical protein
VQANTLQVNAHARLKRTPQLRRQRLPALAVLPRRRMRGELPLVRWLAVARQAHIVPAGLHGIRDGVGFPLARIVRWHGVSATREQLIDEGIASLSL